MCEPVSIALGAAQAAGGMMQANAQHQAAQAAARRQNIINEQNYQQELAIRAHKDMAKGQAFKAKLDAYAQARSAEAKQKELNQLEANRASITAQQELREKQTEAAFKGQDALVKSIQAQGTILAEGRASGQSLLLSLMEEERALGFEEAQINATLHDATTSYKLAEWGIELDKYAGDVKAYNAVPQKPIAPYASIKPVKAPKVSGPSKQGLFGSYLSSAVSGVGTGLSTYSTISGNEALANAFGVEHHG